MVPADAIAASTSYPSRAGGAPLPAVVLLQMVPAAAAVAFLLSGSESLAGLAVLCSLSLVCAGGYVLARGGVVSFVALFVACYAGLHLLYPTTALLLDLDVPHDERIAQYGFLTVGGLALFLIVHALTSRRRRSPRVPELNPNHVSQAVWIFLVPLVGALLLVVGSWSSLGELVRATRVSMKEGGSSATLAAQYLWMVGSPSVVLGPLHLRRRAHGWIPFLLLVVVAGAAGLLAFRTRSILILLLGSLLMGLWLQRRVPKWRTTERRRDGRLKSPAAWRLIVIGVVAVVMVSYVRVARGLFEERGLVGLTQVDIGAAVLHNLNRGDLAFTPIVFDVLEYVPERADYLKGQSYYRLFFAPIPRMVWPDKPPNTQRIVAGWLNPGLQQQTTPPGIQGDLYINFGLFGIVGFIGFGCLFGFLDRWSGLGRLIAVGAGIVPVFHLVRGGFTNPILLLATLCIAATIAAAVAEGRLRFAMRPVRGLAAGPSDRDAAA